MGLLAACSGGAPGGPRFVPASADARRNVMVIDEGFDLAAAELQGKVAAALTISCAAPAADSGDAGVDGGSLSFGEIKQQYLAALAVSDDSCHLDPGVSAKPDPLPGIAKYRQRWNDALRKQQFLDVVFTDAERQEIAAALVPELMRFPYHGTATSGTVAHDDPDVRLVLVERPLATDASIAQSYTCIAQSDLDLMVALLTDPDVHDAYVHQPLARVDADLAGVLDMYQVGIVSESFSRPARVVLEQLQAAAGCAPVDFAPYYTALNGAERARAQAAGGRVVLTVQAAGNDAAQVDTPADLIECAPGDPTRLLVGSYDLAQERSTFSNFGACVDVYAPGELIVAPYAGGWLLPVSGTSLAAPMVVRLVSLTAATPYDPAGARAQLLAQRLSDGSLTIADFPNDFFYLPGERPAATSALRAGPFPPAHSGHDQPRDRFEIQRALGPLYRLRGIVRR